MLVEWKDSYSTGLNDIDAHHKKLLDLLNQSYFIILKNNHQPETAQLLDELLTYAKYHFSTEEDLMREHDCQYLEQHALEHMEFTNKVFSYKIEYLKSNKYLSVELFDFIKNWLLDHILKSDAVMGRDIRCKICS